MFQSMTNYNTIAGPGKNYEFAKTDSSKSSEVDDGHTVNRDAYNDIWILCVLIRVLLL